MTETQRRFGVLLAVFAAAMLAVFALYAVMVQTEGGQDLDAAAYSGLEVEPGLGSNLADTILQAFTLGSMALGAFAIAGIGYSRGRVSLALVPVAVIAGSLVTTEVLKHVILERPDLLAIGDTTNTYPSGHTTIAAGLGVGAILVVPASVRPAVTIGAVAFVSAIGVATVAGGWHRPSDVLGAYLVTVGVAALVVAGARRLAPRHAREPEQPFGTLGAVALGGVLGIIGVFAIAIAEQAGEIDWGSVDRGLLASAAILPASAAILIGALAAAVFGTSEETAPI